jgi:drug/metabolite transporter (DMT)-like permease
MTAARIIGIILIVAGVLGLVYQQVSYTREAAQAKIGPLELTVKERETVNVPLWASIGAIGAGVVILVAGGGRRK